jgi:uncharacterized damage-inducible protein DinB
MTSTGIGRVDPPLATDEVTMLRAFLDYHRDTLRRKTAGLTSEQLSATHPPSSMTLGGMLKHLALVEDSWFSVVLLGNEDAEPWRSVDWDADRDWEWHTAADDDPAWLRNLFDESVEAADRCIDVALADGGVDRLSARESRHEGESHFSLRWILLHMIEEYARHNGHADLIRESIDGETGE